MIVDTPGQLSLEFSSAGHAMTSADFESALRRVHRRMKPRTPVPAVEAAFVPAPGANHSATLENGTLRVEVSDLFDNAPPDVVEALAAILLAKLYRKKIDRESNTRYRRYMMTREMRERSRRARLDRGRAPRTTGPRGRFHDLGTLFDQLNAAEFDGSLHTPTISWTARSTHTLLGRYDFDRDIIFVSRSLDRAAVPDYVVRYILFHEMLHMKHGTRYENDREVVHPPEFRREERRFEFYDAANRWLEQA